MSRGRNNLVTTFVVLLMQIMPSTSVAEDTRQLVTMPAQALQFMRADMLEHLLTINEIVGYLAEGKLDDAANIAETKMGMQSMGKHRGSGMGPGRHMPMGMRSLGMQLHQVASEFARVARTGDKQKTYRAFQKVTSSCVSCHYSYRTH